MSDSGESRRSTKDRGRSSNRVRRPDTWKYEVAKKKRNTGVSYVSANTGKIMPARSIGPLCKCGCMSRLGDKVKTIFKDFWQLGNYEKQNEYIARLVHSVNVQRSRVEPGKQSRRTQTIQYSVRSDEVEYKVCAAGFLSIHGISRKRVRTVVLKLQSAGVMQGDKRGLGETATKVAPKSRELVREHIRSFLSFSNRNRRAKSSKRRRGLNISKMYTLYRKWLEDEHPEESMVTLSYYRSVFKEDFNKGLDPPNADVLNKYEKWNNALSCLDGNADAAHVNEIKRERIPRLQRTLQDPTVQQTLPTPRIYAGTQFYQRKLQTFRFGIHVQLGNAIMYMWDETEAKRGSNEITSCRKCYIESQLMCRVLISAYFENFVPQDVKLLRYC